MAAGPPRPPRGPDEPGPSPLQPLLDRLHPLRHRLERLSPSERRNIGLAALAISLAVLALSIAICAAGSRDDADVDGASAEGDGADAGGHEVVPEGALITTWTGVDRPIRAIGADLPGRERYLAVLDASGALTVWEMKTARVKQQISLAMAPERARLRLEPEREVLHVRLAAVDDRSGLLLAAHYRGRYGALFSEQRDGCRIGLLALDGPLLALSHADQGVTLHLMDKKGFSPCRLNLPDIQPAAAATTDEAADTGPPPPPEARRLSRRSLWLGPGVTAEALALVRTASTTDRRGRLRERYLLALGNEAHEVELWEIVYQRGRLRGVRLEVLRGHRAQIHDLRFARGGGRLISLDAGGKILRWDLDREPVVARRQLQLDALPSARALLTLDEGGQQVGYVDARGRARLVDLDSGRLLYATPPTPERPPTALHLTAEHLVVARDDPPVLEFWGQDVADTP